MHHTRTQHGNITRRSGYGRTADYSCRLPSIAWVLCLFQYIKKGELRQNIRIQNIHRRMGTGPGIIWTVLQKTKQKPRLSWEDIHLKWCNVGTVQGGMQGDGCKLHSGKATKKKRDWAKECLSKATAVQTTSSPAAAFCFLATIGIRS